MEFVIRSEEDAYTFLEQATKGAIDRDHVEVKFEDWPKLHFHLKGERYHSTITTKEMNGFISLQKEIYKSIAIAKYNSPDTKLLTKEERDEFQIEVKVKDGTSTYDIDLQAILMKLVETVGGKMEPIHVVTIAVTLGVLYFGNSAFRSYLEQRRLTREQELRSEEQRAQIESLKFTSEQETKRSQILADVIKDNARLTNLKSYSENAHRSIVESIANADEAEVFGVEISGDVTRQLIKNARRKSMEVRLDGRYRILHVDSTHPDEFKVRLRRARSGEEFSARVQDTSLTQDTKRALQDAEWSRKYLALRINAKEIEGSVRDAVVMEAKAVPESEQEERKDIDG